MTLNDGSVGGSSYTPPGQGHGKGPGKPPKPPKPPKPGPKVKPKNYNVASASLEATEYRRELAPLQRKRYVPGGIIYNLAIGSASGAGAASAVALGLALSVGSAAGSGAVSGVSLTGAVAVGTAAGAGAASGVTAQSVYSVGQAIGFGTANGISSIFSFSIGTAVGVGRARAVGTGVGRILPFDSARAWSIDIYDTVVQAAGYDPITFVLRVYYVQLGLVVDVGGLPRSVTNAIEMSPNPQSYILSLVAQARN
jgi:hypothetical protein